MTPPKKPSPKKPSPSKAPAKTPTPTKSPTKRPSPRKSPSKSPKPPKKAHKLIVPALFEFENRPVYHRPFGPNQPTLFLVLSEAKYNLHKCDDISYAGFLIAMYIPNDGWIIRRTHTDPLESNFSRNGSAMRLRNNAHFGAGLRTPDGSRFVRISVLGGKVVGEQVRTFYAVGQVRGSDAYYETITEEWDHEAWKEKYGARYQKWLDHLFWATDVNNHPQRPKNKKGRLEERPGGGVLQNGSVSDLPEGWLYRLHRDEKAGVDAYNQNKGKWLV